MAYRNRSRFRTVMSSPITLVIAAILFFFLARAAWSVHTRAAISADRLVAAEAELIELEEAHSSAVARVNRLSSEDGIRAEIRERYRAVEPGESVAVIIESATASSATTTAPFEEPGWWSRLFERD